MDNPRDWSAGLWLIIRQGIIILFVVALVVASCAMIWRAFITG